MKQLLDFLLQLYLRFKFSCKDIIFEGHVKLGRNSSFEGKNRLCSGVKFISSSLGKGSYIGPECIFINTDIGRYCSIGPRVKTIIGTHPSHTFVSTHPAFFSLQKQAGFTFSDTQVFQEFNYVDKTNKISILIENDVWIGSDVIIMEGVKIGNGAIIAAGSMVNKDVLPYSIVGGIPAKALKKRFIEEHCNFLDQFKWWDKDENWLKENVNIFKDIEHFYEKFN